MPCDGGPEAENPGWKVGKAKTGTDRKACRSPLSLSIISNLQGRRMSLRRYDPDQDRLDHREAGVD